MSLLSLRGRPAWVTVLIIAGIIALRTATLIHREQMESSPKIAPPDAEAVAARLLCLKAMAARIEMEGLASTVPAEIDKQKADQALSNAHAEFMDNLYHSLPLAQGFSQQELQLLRKPPGQWERQELIDASWKAECSAVLAWSLGIVNVLAPYDQEVDNHVAMAAIPEPTGAVALTTAARLRPPAQIERARDQAELWLWRARTHRIMNDPELLRKNPLPAGVTFPQLVAKAAQAAEKDGCFKRIGGDFPAFGKPYAQLTGEEAQQMTSIATERLRALNWLCGYSADWDDVPLDT